MLPIGWLFHNNADNNSKYYYDYDYQFTFIILLLVVVEEEVVVVVVLSFSSSAKQAARPAGHPMEGLLEGGVPLLD